MIFCERCSRICKDWEVGRGVICNQCREELATDYCVVCGELYSNDDLTTELVCLDCVANSIYNLDKGESLSSQASCNNETASSPDNHNP